MSILPEPVEFCVEMAVDRTRGHSAWGRFGVQLAGAFRCQVQSVEDKSPAAAAGLFPGTIVTELDGSAVKHPADAEKKLLLTRAPLVHVKVLVTYDNRVVGTVSPGGDAVMPQVPLMLGGQLSLDPLPFAEDTESLPGPCVSFFVRKTASGACVATGVDKMSPPTTPVSRPRLGIAMTAEETKWLWVGRAVGTEAVVQLLRGHTVRSVTGDSSTPSGYFVALGSPIKQLQVAELNARDPSVSVHDAGPSQPLCGNGYLCCRANLRGPSVCVFRHPEPKYRLQPVATHRHDLQVKAGSRVASVVRIHDPKREKLFYDGNGTITELWCEGPLSQLRGGQERCHPFGFGIRLTETPPNPPTTLVRCHVLLSSPCKVRLGTELPSASSPLAHATYCVDPTPYLPRSASISQWLGNHDAYHIVYRGGWSEYVIFDARRVLPLYEVEVEVEEQEEEEEEVVVTKQTEASSAAAGSTAAPIENNTQKQKQKQKKRKGKKQDGILQSRSEEEAAVAAASSLASKKLSPALSMAFCIFVTLWLFLLLSE